MKFVDSHKFVAWHRSKGFTLIEVLIVVAIIGLLASIVLVGYGSFRSRGRDTRRVADLNEAQKGLELYYLKFQYYPAVAASDSWSSLKNSLVSAGIGVNNISNDPLAPNRTYKYGASSDFQNYVLAATLEDVSNPAFQNSPRGTIYGISCDPPNYCVQF